MSNNIWPEGIDNSTTQSTATHLDSEPLLSIENKNLFDSIYNLQINVKPGHRLVIKIDPIEEQEELVNLNETQEATGTVVDFAQYKKSRKSSTSTTEFFDGNILLPNAYIRGNQNYLPSKKTENNDKSMLAKGEILMINTNKIRIINYTSIFLIIIGLLFSLVGGSSLSIICLLSSAAGLSLVFFVLRRVTGLDIINPNISLMIIVGAIGLIITTIAAVI